MLIIGLELVEAVPGESIRWRMAWRTLEAWRASAEVVLRADQMVYAVRRVAMRLTLSSELERERRRGNMLVSPRVGTSGG